MVMKKYMMMAAAAAAVLSGTGAWAQNNDGGTTATTPPPAQPTSDDARNALQKQEGDVDNAKLLKDTLTAVKKEYSLIPKGRFSLVYDATYNYLGQQQIDAQFNSGSLTLFNITNEAQHQLTNQVSVDYGLRDDVTLNASLPVVSQYASNSTGQGFTNSFGDMGFGARWQPLGRVSNMPTMTLNAGLRLPTGNSPFKGIADLGNATGSGFLQGNVGVNFNKVIDPIALFGSFGFNYGMTARHLLQQRGSEVLTSVKPGQTFSFALGYAYSLTYTVSTTVSFQEAWSRSTHLSFQDGTTSSTQQQTAAVLSLGLGVRVSPKTTISTTLGIGLTAQTPNFSIDVNFPLQFD